MGSTSACCSPMTSRRGSSTSSACSTPATRHGLPRARSPASRSSTRRWRSPRCAASSTSCSIARRCRRSTEIPGHPREDYVATVLERFANTGVRDQIARLCIDGTAKFPTFLVPTIVHQLRHDGPIRCAAAALAGWARYLATVPVPEQAYDASGDIARRHARRALEDPLLFLRSTRCSLRRCARAGGSAQRSPRRGPASPTKERSPRWQAESTLAPSRRRTTGMTTTDSGGSKLQHHRQREIYVLALKQGSVDVADLARRFDVTTETIRRDLSDLQERHLLRRVHGGAVPVERRDHEPMVDARGHAERRGEAAHRARGDPRGTRPRLGDHRLGLDGTTPRRGVPGRPGGRTC